MTDKLTTGQRWVAGAQASSADPMNALAPEEPGHHGRAARATSPTPNPAGLTQEHRCDLCREWKTCNIDWLGRWFCPPCRSCFDA